MMKKFLGDDFLLTNKIAEELYHNHAADLPIIDYHNHLSPASIATNHQFKNITQAWLYGDHYKWRAMRANGIDEKFITGDAPDQDKFKMWAATVPYTLRNPLYHWTHLELRRHFGINDLLSSSSASDIYTETASMMQSDSHSCVGLLKQMKVETLCTTDDPIDDLQHHLAISQQSNTPNVFPSFRPDKALSMQGTSEYKKYITSLSAISKMEINSLDTLIEALQNRVDFFHDAGCRVSDLGFNQIPLFDIKATGLDADYQSVLNGQELSSKSVENLQAFVLTHLCKMYHAKGWVQQFHLGALRNNNERALRNLGPDISYNNAKNYFDFKQK